MHRASCFLSLFPSTKERAALLLTSQKADGLRAVNCSAFPYFKKIKWPLDEVWNSKPHSIVLSCGAVNRHVSSSLLLWDKGVLFLLMLWEVISPIEAICLK